MRTHLTASAAILSATVLFFLGCSSSKPNLVGNPEKVCREKYAQARKDYDKGHDADAQTKLRDITVDCAGYDYVEEAQFLLGQSYFRTEQWLEAETEFGILVQNWERTKHMEEARWKICRSGFYQAPPWDRDPSLTQGAMEKERAFVADYPRGPWSDSARADLADLVGRLAERRYETGKLYLKMDEPLAATIYFKLLLKEFPESDKVPPARIDMARAYWKLFQFDRAKECLDSLAMDSSLAKPYGKRIIDARKDLESARGDFEAKRAREAAEARQGQL
jgi:outer membrane protein assembly factor BamD